MVDTSTVCQSKESGHLMEDYSVNRSTAAKLKKWVVMMDNDTSRAWLPPPVGTPQVTGLF